MRLRPLTALAGAALATLALASSAQAAPTTPVLHPIPYFTCGNVTASWTKSTPDPGGVILGYRIDLGNLTLGTSTAKTVGGLSTFLGPLINHHKYVVRVRAIQFKGGAITFSASSGRVFQNSCLFLDPGKIVKDYVEYNPWPDCPQCGLLDGLNIKDPVILNARPPLAERFRGIDLEVDGVINFR